MVHPLHSIFCEIAWRYCCTFWDPESHTLDYAFARINSHATRQYIAHTKVHTVSNYAQRCGYFIYRYERRIYVTLGWSHTRIPTSESYDRL